MESGVQRAKWGSCSSRALRGPVIQPPSQLLVQQCQRGSGRLGEVVELSRNARRFLGALKIMRLAPV